MRFIGQWPQQKDNIISLQPAFTVLLSVELDNNIFHLKNARDDSEVLVYGFDTSEYQFYNEYEFICQQFETSLLNTTINSKFTLELCLSKIQLLIKTYSSQPIYVLAEGIVYFHLNCFEKAISSFRLFLRLAENSEGKKFAIDIIEVALEYLTKWKEHRRQKDPLARNFIAMIGCISGNHIPNFRWSYDILINMLRINRDLSTDEFGNIIYLHNSYLFSDYKTLFQTVLKEQKYIVIYSHAGTDTNDGNAKLKVDYYNNPNVEEKFDDIYNYITIDLNLESLIIVLGCGMKLNGTYDKLIYVKEDVSTQVQLYSPFSLSFFFNLVYFSSEEFSFNIAKMFTSLYTTHYKYLEMR